MMSDMDEEDRLNPKLLATSVEEAFDGVMENGTYQDYVALRAAGFERDMRKLMNDMVALCRGQGKYWRENLANDASYAVISTLASEIYLLSPDLRKMPDAFMGVPGTDMT